MLGISSLAVLRIPGSRGTVAIDVRGIGGVALAQLVGLGVQRQGVGIVDGLVGAAAREERAEEAGLLAVAGGVIVGGRGAEALFLLAVAPETEFRQGGDDEEDAVGVC